MSATLAAMIVPSIAPKWMKAARPLNSASGPHAASDQQHEISAPTSSVARSGPAASGTDAS